VPKEETHHEIIQALWPDDRSLLVRGHGCCTHAAAAGTGHGNNQGMNQAPGAQGMDPGQANQVNNQMQQGPRDRQPDPETS
jgi:hypothetical protein